MAVRGITESIKTSPAPANELLLNRLKAIGILLKKLCNAVPFKKISPKSDERLFSE